MTLLEARQKASEARATVDRASCRSIFQKGGPFMGEALDAYAAAIRVLALAEVVAMLRTKRTPEGETITSASHAADVIEEEFPITQVFSGTVNVREWVTANKPEWLEEETP